MRVSITSPLVQPSPNGRRVGIRIVTFEACSGFTRVTARRIAQPPKVTFVTRLRSRQLPSETARQLPDLSTIIRVEPSSTDDSRLQGALPIRDIPRTSPNHRVEPSQSSSVDDGSCHTAAEHFGRRQQRSGTSRGARKLFRDAFRRKTWVRIVVKSVYLAPSGAAVKLESRWQGVSSRTVLMDKLRAAFSAAPMRRRPNPSPRARAPPIAF